MLNFPVKDLAQIISAPCEGDTQASFLKVNTDSRTVQPGDCFFAICGENFDGHDYVADALKKGAACAVVNQNYQQKAPCLLKVKDTIEALGKFAAEYRRRMPFKVVAITGSAGKTTTRQITHHVLSSRFKTTQSQKNFNNQIGLPLTLLEANPEDEIVVAEIGADRPGEIEYLTKIAQPDIAVVTNVHPAHLAGFGSIETIAREKVSIAQGLGEKGTLIINGDSKALEYSLVAEKLSLKSLEQTGPPNIKIIKFGCSNQNDIRIENIVCTSNAATFEINGSKVNLPLPGRGNVENTAAAWVICKCMGLAIDDFATELQSLKSVPMRAELLQIGTLKVLNDCYNANPASMKNALEILADIARTDKASDHRMVFFCGDMADLGTQTQKLHEQLGQEIANSKISLLIAIGDSATITSNAARDNARHKLETKCFQNASSACQKLEKLVKDYDIVLIKGSRISQLEQIVEKLNELFR
ncbi:MAG: UDP-N-acetylmuramoyl-tripeptide--D-alanyl-D-alanine ligase [Planctomycetota bacterium]|jgi:UDP-N-acetylmuramoyl-tripeptide--D-alanyl-D-alanine ligase